MHAIVLYKTISQSCSKKEQNSNYFFISKTTNYRKNAEKSDIQIKHHNFRVKLTRSKHQIPDQTKKARHPIKAFSNRPVLPQTSEIGNEPSPPPKRAGLQAEPTVLGSAIDKVERRRDRFYRQRRGEEQKIRGERVEWNRGGSIQRSREREREGSTHVSFASILLHTSLYGLLLHFRTATKRIATQCPKYPYWCSSF